jgi:hypothetical protein
VTNLAALESFRTAAGLLQEIISPTARENLNLFKRCPLFTPRRSPPPTRRSINFLRVKTAGWNDRNNSNNFN